MFIGLDHFIFYSKASTPLVAQLPPDDISQWATTRVATASLHPTLKVDDVA